MSVLMSVFISYLRRRRRRWIIKLAGLLSLCQVSPVFVVCARPSWSLPSDAARVGFFSGGFSLTSFVGRAEMGRSVGGFRSFSVHWGCAEALHIDWANEMFSPWSCGMGIWSIRHRLWHGFMGLFVDIGHRYGAFDRYRTAIWALDWDGTD